MALIAHGSRTSSQQAAAAVISASLLALCPALGYQARAVAAPADAPPPETSEAGQAAYDAGRFADALAIWRPLAALGDARAAYGLGLLYDLGQGVAQDAAKAYGWYLRSAEAGFAAAQFNVAVMDDSGVGVARDAAGAALWYARAAAHDHARAAYNLAQLYEAGDGVPRNLDLAETWYQAAAAHGVQDAARKLGLLRKARSAAEISAAARPLTPAIPAAALADPAPAAGDGVTLELTWAAQAQAPPVDFFVEVLAVDDAPPQVAYAGYVRRSSILVRLPPKPARYAWRVYTVAMAAADYAPSAWSVFSVP